MKNPREYFEAKYRSSKDPWNFATDSYEQQRYRNIINSLPPKNYKVAVEPGCSIGILTSQLAKIASRVFAYDISETAVEIAKTNNKHLKNVIIYCSSLADIAISRETDLIVLSEIGYYFDESAWKNIIKKMITTCKPGTTILASHWLGHSPDHVQKTDTVHGVFGTFSNLKLELKMNYIAFRLDRWIIT